VSAYLWGKKKLHGSVYDLSHLHPFLLEVIPGNAEALRVKVVVSFGLHTFTRERHNEDTPDLFMGENGDPRSFCPIRYACSLHLPNLIKRAGAIGGNVYFSHQGNFLVVDNVPAVKGEYAAIFKIEPATTEGVEARMFVISAHERIKPLAKLEKISLYTLVRKVAAGEPIPWPKKK
jgi:hypothetical protein